MPKDELWGLVLGTARLRLTAYSVASLHESNGSSRDGNGSGNGASDRDGTDTSRAAFQVLAGRLAEFYDRIADQVSAPAGQVVPVSVPDVEGPGLPVGVACEGDTPPDYRPDALWVGEYLYHLGIRAQAVAAPAAHLASIRARPWWR
jgi:hypothetical protein